MSGIPWHQHWFFTLFVIPILLAVVFTILSPMISSKLCNSKRIVIIEGYIVEKDTPLVGANVMVERVDMTSTNEEGKFVMQVPTQESRYKSLGCSTCDINTDIPLRISYQGKTCFQVLQLHNEALNDDTVKIQIDMNDICK